MPPVLLPLIGVRILAGFLARKGGMKLAKDYAKKNGKRITEAVITKAKNLNKIIKKPKKPTKKITSTKANITKKTKTTTKAGKGGPAKVKSNKAETQKPDKSFFDKAGIKKPVGGSTALVRYNPRQIALVKNKPKNLLTKADKALLAAITAGAVGNTGGTKKTETKKPVPKAPEGFKKKGSKGRGKGGVTMDDMLDKNVRGVPAGFKTKGSKPKGKGQFGANISFASGNVKTLKQNAKDLKKQIDGLDITNFQKLRLKKLIDTRDPGYSMGESYSRAFNEVKRRVKDKKLNFAIDVSGYAG